MVKEKPLGAGSSSFSLIHTDSLFEELNLCNGCTFLDMACGPGDYSIAASKHVGDKGLVYAVDLWEEAIDALSKKVAARNIKNIRMMVGNVSQPLPIGAGAVDVCLISTVLHDFVQEGVADKALEEVARVLKPKGLLAILEFKKIEGPPGPPLRIRLNPEEVERWVLSHGFISLRLRNIGPYNYLVIFEKR
jgi:ubiquinone/menaquinone biosynthesis C-methylase UbiE